MRRTRIMLVTLVLALVVSTAAYAGNGGASAHAAGDRSGLAPGVAIGYKAVKTGLDDPAGFTFSPSGNIWFLERGTGRVRILNPATGSVKTVYRIRRVDGSGERGALGIALHPQWPAKPFVYVYVTRRATTIRPIQNELIRLSVSDGHVDKLKILFHSPLSKATNHNGGRILFGQHRRLFIVIGENANPLNAQDLSSNLRGKILRVNTNGKPVASNPFGNRVFAYGIRNSFGFAFDPSTHRLWETENGPECNDELNLIVRGGNFAWGSNESCGSSTPPTDTNNSGPDPQLLPKAFFGTTLGITGAAFCHGCRLGSASRGKLFFGDVNDGVLRRVGLNSARDDLGTPVSILDEPGGAIYSMEVSPQGRIYFSNPGGIYQLVRA
ncbi:MAG: PQQ-dependent sugar dehydrogenase [Actinomycetota bacterium]|nr:PQQ-dependent sugar dehydrogenase [Actinomycetota bacterium]